MIKSLKLIVQYLFLKCYTPRRLRTALPTSCREYGAVAVVQGKGSVEYSIRSFYQTIT